LAIKKSLSIVLNRNKHRKELTELLLEQFVAKKNNLKNKWVR